MKKTYVLDTNVLLHSSLSMESFQDNDVVIPMAVIEELDKFKKNQDELGRNARSVIRRLDSLRTQGNLRQGVSLKSNHSQATGNLFVLTSASFDLSHVEDELRNVFSADLGADSPDNRILRVAFALHQQPERHVVFISKDINLRLKADALGLKVEDYERGKVDFDSLYRGFEVIDTNRNSIDRLYREKVAEPGNLRLLNNQFVVFQNDDNGRHSAIARLHADGKLHLLDPGHPPVWNIMPRNKEQRMALDLLCDPELKLVTLVGGAGTGKTLLALAAALQSTLRENLYDRILVSRPIIPLGNDIGYLPGDKGTKLSSWMQPIFDNLQFLLQGEEKGGKRGSGSTLTPEGLLHSHRVELEALTYIRGRSISRQFLIVDEAQNLTPHEIKTIVSRAGEDTKIVLTGDPYQIDNPYLDSSSNGLTCAAERMKGQLIHGHITLAKSERSELAALAAKLL